ncbi:MAG: 50S ribosomal protein L6 [Phycisphaeraceae bacterium]
MSRIGKQPVAIPANVKVAISGRAVTVESGKNKLTFTHSPRVTVTVDDAAKAVVVERKSADAQSRALHGTTRAVLANMVQGVTKGFTKELEIVGVGWSVQLQGNKVVLNVGYANPRVVPVPAGVKVEVQQNKIKVSGADRQAVGQLAAVIRSQREPEPYNGKGIKYSDEVIIRKQGKAFAGGGAA